VLNEGGQKVIAESLQCLNIVTKIGQLKSHSQPNNQLLDKTCIMFAY